MTKPNALLAHGKLTVYDAFHPSCSEKFGGEMKLNEPRRQKLGRLAQYAKLYSDSLTGSRLGEREPLIALD